MAENRQPAWAAFRCATLRSTPPMPNNTPKTILLNLTDITPESTSALCSSHCLTALRRGDRSVPGSCRSLPGRKPRQGLRRGGRHLFCNFETLSTSSPPVEQTEGTYTEHRTICQELFSFFSSFDAPKHFHPAPEQVRTPGGKAQGYRKYFESSEALVLGRKLIACDFSLPAEQARRKHSNG